MEDIPTHQECLNILKEAGASQELIDHAESVTKIALEIAELIMGTNHELVEAGAMLHDIGRTKSNEIDHAIRGAEIANELELPESLLKIIKRHIGAGISVEDAKDLEIEEGNYIPQSTEEKIVAHSDNLIDNTKRRKVEEVIKELTDDKKYRPARRIINLHNKLSEQAGMDIDELVPEEE